MRSTDAYADLLRMGRPIVTTREAAARWQTEERTAGRRLRVLAEAGLVQRLRRGLWAMDMDIEPFAVAPYLTAPYPAYVSLWTALSEHDMIEQVPRIITVASLDRARRITTSVGTYGIHHLAPEVFGGHSGSDRTGYLATPEKALFDIVYIRAAAGSRAYFPELSLPPGFDQAELWQWTERIDSARLRTLVEQRLHETLSSITAQAG